MNLALIFIGTRRFASLFPLFHSSFERHFLPSTPRTYFAFSDDPSSPSFAGRAHTQVHQTDHLPWPLITLLRFHMMRRVADQLASYDWVFYLDSDLVAQADISPEEFLPPDKDYLGVIHPGQYARYKGYLERLAYLNSPASPIARARRRLVRSAFDLADRIRDPAHATLHRYRPPFETDPASRAHIPHTGSMPPYRAGGFWGARGHLITDLLDSCIDAIDDDLSRNYIARYHDESHINRFLADREPRVHTHSPIYCHPGESAMSLPIKILHADKWTPEWLAAEEMRYRTPQHP